MQWFLLLLFFGSFPEIDSIAVKEYEGGKP
jgi:hypothetical protein